MADAERALWALEEATEGILAFVKAASYGLRLAVKRVGDLGRAPGGGPHPSAELEKLTEALAHSDDNLSDAAALVLGDHFRGFLARALDLPEVPGLPGTVVQIEELAGTPGALDKASPLLALGLQLYRAALGGGRLDARAMQALGTETVELRYPDGKVKMFREGDRVTLSENLVEEIAEAYLEAAQALRLRLLTS